MLERDQRRRRSRCSQILNDVLDLSKVEAGHLTLAPVPSSTSRELVAAWRSTFADGARRKGLALEWHADPRCRATPAVDPARLRQVLLNLVGNGVKFTETGTVSIRARRLRVAARGAADLRSSCATSGIGISREDQDRLFQPFVQAEAPDLAQPRRHRSGPGDLAPPRRADERAA